MLILNYLFQNYQARTLPVEIIGKFFLFSASNPKYFSQEFFYYLKIKLNRVAYCFTSYCKVINARTLPLVKFSEKIFEVYARDVPSSPAEVIAFSQVPSGNMEILKEFAFSQVPSGNMEILKEFAFTRITQTQLSNYSQKVLNNLNHLYYL